MTALIQWPANTLPPGPFDADYAYTPGDSRVRTTLEQGTPRQRRKTLTALDVYQLRWQFAAEQYEIFRGFVDTALSGGGGWFAIDVFVDVDYANLPARFVKGSFDRRSRAGGRFEVTAQLEVKDVPVMSEADLEAAIGAAGDGLQEWPSDYLDPDPLNDSFVQVIADGINRDDLPGGDLEQDRPFRQMPALYEWSIPLTNSEYRIFKAWLYWRVQKGTGWFSAPMMRGGSYETQKVRIVAGSRKDTRSGGDWIVTAQIEVADLAPYSVEQTLPAIILNEDDVDLDTWLAGFDGLIADYVEAVS
jgi:hypothetical protein